MCVDRSVEEVVARIGQVGAIIPSEEAPAQMRGLSLARLLCRHSKAYLRWEVPTAGAHWLHD